MAVVAVVPVAATFLEVNQGAVAVHRIEVAESVRVASTFPEDSQGVVQRLQLPLAGMFQEDSLGAAKRPRPPLARRSPGVPTFPAANPGEMTRPQLQSSLRRPSVKTRRENKDVLMRRLIGPPVI